ncbi:MAG: hypothetical protein JXR80_08995 [Deltaproteobacteria bacterium]|nr:hypothetical protein [Deltaproteobacteria bacterium]
MKKELFIHVGASKTGTTGIQEFLFLNEKKLKRVGLTVPKIGRFDKIENGIVHHPLAGWLGGDIFVDPMPLWIRVSQLPFSRVLVSSEALSWKTFSEDAEQFFTEIKKLFFDWDVKIIFYIRRQDQWIQSTYVEFVKSGKLFNGEKLDKEFCDKYSRSLAQSVFLFSKVFGDENLIVRPYERAQLKGGSIYEDFFEIFNIDIDSSYKFPRPNVNNRLSSGALEFKRIFNSICNTREDTFWVRKALSKFSEKFYENCCSSFLPINFISPEIANRIVQLNEEDYEKIARTYLNRKEGKLFLESLSESGEEPNLSIEDLAKISSYLFLIMYKSIAGIEKSIAGIEKKITELESTMFNLADILPDERGIKICIYGCGRTGMKVLEAIDNCAFVKVECFLDSFESGTFFGFKKIKIEEFAGEKIDYNYILIASCFHKEIMSILKKNGLDGKAYVPAVIASLTSVNHSV